MKNRRQLGPDHTDIDTGGTRIEDKDKNVKHDEDSEKTTEKADRAITMNTTDTTNTRETETRKGVTPDS